MYKTLNYIPIHFKTFSHLLPPSLSHMASAPILVKSHVRCVSVLIIPLSSCESLLYHYKPSPWKHWLIWMNEWVTCSLISNQTGEAAPTCRIHPQPTLLSFQFCAHIAPLFKKWHMFIIKNVKHWELIIIKSIHHFSGSWWWIDVSQCVQKLCFSPTTTPIWVPRIKNRAPTFSLNHDDEQEKQRRGGDCRYNYTIPIPRLIHSSKIAYDCVPHGSTPWGLPCECVNQLFFQLFVSVRGSMQNRARARRRIAVSFSLSSVCVCPPKTSVFYLKTHRDTLTHETQRKKKGYDWDERRMAIKVTGQKSLRGHTKRGDRNLLSVFLYFFLFRGQKEK